MHPWIRCTMWPRVVGNILRIMTYTRGHYVMTGTRGHSVMTDTRGHCVMTDTRGHYAMIGIE